MPDGTIPKPRGLGVLEKAMALLNVVSARRAPMTFTELLQASALPKATLHRILATLVREGLLRHDATTKTFRLGFRLLELAHEVWSDFDLRVAAQDELVRLRDTLDATIELAVADGDHAVVIACERTGRESAPSSVGTRLPLLETAIGRAIAAHADTARDGHALRAELDLTRTRGYAIEEQEDTLTVAAPIFDYEGRPIGAIAASGPRQVPSRAHAWSWELVAAGRAISHDAGGDAMSISPRPAPRSAAPAVDVRCVSDARCLLGEGPLWSPRDGALYWVDILAPAVHRLVPTEGREDETRLGVMSSIAIPKASGGLLVATPRGLMGLHPPERTLVPFAHPDPRPTHRYNDGKCDRRGRLWIGSMDMAANANRGSLFRVEGDGAWKRVDGGFTVPNGLGFSPDGTRMYFTDTFRRTVYAYDFDLASGAIEHRRPLIVIDEADGKPDGLTVDEDGCLWIALWDGWAVARFSPEGQPMMRVRMPVPRPTSCCFGGSDLSTLYVTSGSVRLSEKALAEAPLSGAVFAVEVDGVRGLPETTFAG